VTIGATINFKPAAGNMGSVSQSFRSRAVMIYTYDRNGNTRPPVATDYQTLDGVKSNGGILMIEGAGGVYKNEYAMPWKNPDAFSARFEARVILGLLDPWPAVALQPVNVTALSGVLHSGGGVYVKKGGAINTCDVIPDPSHPPPITPSPSLSIKVEAPNWDLGELPRGQGKKFFSDINDYLCFTYSGTAAGGKRFMIDATSAGGVNGGRYRLRGPGGAIPYSVELFDGRATIPLPNIGGRTIPLPDSGRICFAPEFTTDVPADLKAGQYNDVLTFSVVTKT